MLKLFWKRQKTTYQMARRSMSSAIDPEIPMVQQNLSLRQYLILCSALYKWENPGSMRHSLYLSGISIKGPAFYNALKRLQEKELIERSSDGGESGPAYRATGLGLKAVRTFSAMVEKTEDSN